MRLKHKLGVRRYLYYINIYNQYINIDLLVASVSYDFYRMREGEWRVKGAGRACRVLHRSAVERQSWEIMSPKKKIHLQRLWIRREIAEEWMKEFESEWKSWVAGTLKCLSWGPLDENELLLHLDLSLCPCSFILEESMEFLRNCWVRDSAGMFQCFFTHSCPYESSKSLILLSSHLTRTPRSVEGRKPCSAYTVK